MENMYDSEVFSRNENPYLVHNSTNGFFTQVVKLAGTETQKKDKLTNLSERLKDLELRLENRKIESNKNNTTYRIKKRRGTTPNNVLSTLENRIDDDTRILNDFKRKNLQN
jgi:hypothetical protein